METKISNRGQVAMIAWQDRSGLTTLELSERLGVALGTLNAIRQGRRFPGRKLGILLSREMDIPIESWDEAVN